MVLWTLFSRTSEDQPWIRVPIGQFKETRKVKREDGGTSVCIVYSPGAFRNKQEAENCYRHILHNCEAGYTRAQYEVRSYKRLNRKELAARLEESKRARGASLKGN